MRNRSLFGALIALSLVVPLTSCSNPSGLDSISISPASQSLTTGQTTQFSVTGTYGNASHTTTKAVTTGVTWASSNTAVATVTSDGLATAIGAGTTTITASAQGFNGPVSSSATVTVTSSGGGTASGTIVSITVTPGSQSVSGAGQTVQFLAIGTTSSGATVNVTNQVAWTSSATSIATIGVTSGLATSVGAGTTTITALYNDASSGTTATGSAELTVTGGTSTGFTSLQLIPNSQSVSATGQTGQFIALGTTGSGAVLDVTDSSQIAWSSSSPSVATVDATGLATGVSQGSTTITALLTNTDNSIVSATASVNVTLSSPPEPILSLEIIPTSITVNDFNLSGQFIAIATYSTAPYVRDVTNDPSTTWLSSEPNFFPVSSNTGGGPGASAGIVTAEGAGGATIIAESSSTDGTIQTATATFSCPQVLVAAGSNTPPSCPDTLGTGSPLLSTLTIYQRGLNTTNWVVTAPSATGTADVLHCGPGWTGDGGSVCTATYPTFTNGVPTTVVLTSPAGAGAFGGWSDNCLPSDANGNTTPAPAITAGGPNYCVVTLANFSTVTSSYIPSDDVVGIIVN
ncbi:MAG TPA: Ig-like domain-containing protein [Terracidiphilus sp.]|nr:Ig-like domain-containing protein [Terracidiphilus sp.]